VLSALDTTEIYLGKFVKAFGIKGELKFLASDDYWDGVLGSSALELRWLEDGAQQSRAIRVERSRPHGGTFVVKLEGIDDRNDAEREVGGEVYVEIDRLDVDLPDYVLPYQVIGQEVRLEDGRSLGTVKSVVFSAAHDVYEVAGEDGVVLIPAVPEFIVGRDDERGVITVRPIPGLIDG
jgi:16S rRNA processing protein RimM